MSLIILGELQTGMIYALMAAGLYVTFRILDIPDLTVEGSFTLGMTVTVMITSAGYPELALLIAIAAGACAGLVTAFLQTKVKIQPILSGIITMTALYSVNMQIMGGKPNISLYSAGADTIFIKFERLTGLSANNSKLLLISLIVAAVIALLILFFKTRVGLKIRATGDNEEMVRSSSINADLTKCLGFAIGNASVALSGGLLCQYQQYADINYAVGMVVVGLASIIIGEAFFGRRSVTIGFISVVVGSTAYRFIIALALQVKLFDPYWLKFISAVIVVIALSLPVLKTYFQKLFARLKNERGNA
ncbi:MAG TPA: ABC transporter permease [Bacillota bacterium]|nr:ABC transporter permease [Bacillota bacterium]HOK68456.1 ABC transporter permease [Bacillota bacterium]HPP85090.1 ABC transporter permease [Bacillota bacterium]